MQTPDITKIITLASTAVGHSDPIPIQHTAYREEVSPPMSGSKFPDGIQFLVFIADEHVT